MIYRFGTLLSLFCLLHAGCKPPAEETGKLNVVASIEPLAYFAEKVGGRYVSVSVMVPPGGNPHSYEPTPKQMSTLSGATVFIKAGSGVEFELDWMPRILSLNPSLQVCDVSKGITFIAMKEAHSHDKDHDHEDEHGHHEGETAHRHEGNDPHFWLAPKNAVLITRNIEKAFASADPSNKEYFRANSEKLVAELGALHREIAKTLEPVRNRRFLVFHPAWGYYAAAFGLEQLSAEEEGKSLTPRQLREVIGKAKANNIRVVFISAQFSVQQAEAIARGIGGMTKIVDPLARDYQQNLRNATEAFSSAMR